LAELEALRNGLDEESNIRKAVLNQIDRRLEKEALSESGKKHLEEERRREKRLLENVRKAHHEASLLVDTLNDSLESGFNRYWGPLLKEGNENSKFGEQVEKYACVYTPLCQGSCRLGM
ncbi:MAG: HAD family hydrolase, partial [Proteobacteria bacterium]|nr:HAD family hydrolase [Pseudomonadota bacterium]